MKPPRRIGESNLAASREAASELAIAALVFLACEEDRLGRFLALTGLAPESLRAAAREPGFLLGVLDHVMGDEALLLAFANESNVDPQDVARAREALAGTPGNTGAA
jgi:hypothetical protein